MSADPVPPATGPGGAILLGLDPARVTGAHAAQEFEALLLSQLLKGLRRTVPEGGDRSPVREIYQELLDEQLAGHLARHGGIGLARMIQTYLEQAPGGPPAPGKPEATR